ncbi:MAG: glycosyltransferase family 39 protein [Oscillochloridaceae bacterium umkhey_bin13]
MKANQVQFDSRQAAKPPSFFQHWPLLFALIIGAALRLALWDNLPRLGLISDEAEYLASADWLANGRGFAWHTQYLWTRAPLYPLFIAGHFALFGRDLAPVFLSQSLLSLLSVALTYVLARHVSADQPRLRAAPGLAALFTAIYLPLASYAQLLLSETLFITLLLAFFVSLSLERSDQRWPWPLVLAGGLLGLATLTRGLTLGFLPLIVLWLIIRTRQQHARNWLRPAALRLAALGLAFGLVVAPWSLYASRAYGGRIIVDTTGAFNLALGTRTAYDGGRSDEPTRNFVLALLLPGLSLAEREALLSERRGPDGSLQRGAACLFAAGDPQLRAALERAPALSQGERQTLLSAEARCLLLASPSAFVTKSLIELIDLFKINYTGDERLSKGFTLGRLPPWYSLALFGLDDTLYVFALPLAVLGWVVLRTVQANSWQIGSRKAAKPQSLRQEATTSVLHDNTIRRVSTSAISNSLLTLIGLWLLFNLAVAPLLFAINRFRVPLLPFAFILAGVALAGLPLLRPVLRSWYGRLGATLALLLWLVAAAPYAYLEPRAPGADARWSSYLGPYPSSLANTRLALAARPGYLREQELGAALGAGDAATASRILADPILPSYAAAIGLPLLDSLEGRPAEGLERLATQPMRPLEDWQTAVVAGELFRQMGDLPAARRELGPTLVDSVNPVTWSWDWLFPPQLPGDRIELAEDNDLGYIRGFYLGRYDPDLAATTRWATGNAALRFPAAATGAPQTLCLALSGLGWPEDLKLPVVDVTLDDLTLASIPLTRTLAAHCVALPPQPVGSTVLIQFTTTSFVPDALDLIAQQGPQVGQLRLLGFQLAWAEVR